MGYGYDLGHQTTNTIEKELALFYSFSEIKIFKSVVGLKGNSSRANLYKVKHISISKEKALKMATLVKARYAQEAVNVYPEVLKLHPHCQGAILSLIYNRGSSLRSSQKKWRRDPKNGNKLTDPRREMSEIKQAFKSGNIGKIPALIRKSKWVWVGHRYEKGLHRRREEEAVYFEKGLRN